MDTRSHFRDPLTIEATLETAARGLWDVEVRALATMVNNGASLSTPGTRQGLVDLGCGTGRIAANIGAAFKNITLVDFSPEMLELAAEAVKSRNSGSDVETHCVDVTELLTSARTTDARATAFWKRAGESTLVTVGNCLCYITGRANRIRALQTLATTLRHDAKLLISNHVVPTLGMALEALDVDSSKLRRAGEDPFFADALLDTSSDDGSSVHWFTKDLLAAEISAAGLQILQSEESSDGLRAAFLCVRPLLNP